MKKLVILSLLCSLSALLITSYYWDIPYPFYSIGEGVDSFNQVPVYYNGGSTCVHGVNRAPSGYKLGVKWQCVEFVRRYYFEYYGHVMPSPEGNAVDYFKSDLSDGTLNKERNLYQFENSGKFIPKIGDILIQSKGYGHVGIITQIKKNELEIIQQNVNKKTRQWFKISSENIVLASESNQVLGWLSRGR